MAPMLRRAMDAAPPTPLMRTSGMLSVRNRPRASAPIFVRLRRVLLTPSDTQADLEFLRNGASDIAESFENKLLGMICGISCRLRLRSGVGAIIANIVKTSLESVESPTMKHLMTASSGLARRLTSG